MNLIAVLRRASRDALDLVLPPLCLACNAIVAESGTLCAACWQRIDWIAPPFCARCGHPFDDRRGAAAADLLCAACLVEPPVYRRARSVFRYAPASRGLVLGFKHADRLHAAPAFGRWLARVGAELAAANDLVVPVPLHWTRFLRRRYNQSALLAQRFAGATGIVCIPDALHRRRRTPSQGELSRAERRRNVGSAFVVARRYRERVRGRRILLVDDVLTSGATVEACAAALLRAGAISVDVLTLARVVLPRAPI